MKSISFPFLFIAATVFIYTSCQKNPNDRPGSGKADFSKYIAIGNSLTAGQADGGQYLESQQNSYPEIIARQLKTSGGGEFSSAFFPAGQENGSGYLALAGFTPEGLPKIVQVTTKLAIRGQVTAPDGNKLDLLTKYKGPLNNFGVPSIRVSDILDSDYGNKNEFFERVLPEDFPLNKKTYLDFITEKPFTFFTCWLGNNDVLLFAARGGAKADFPTDKEKFNMIYTTLVNKLTAKGAKGVLTTIPDVTKTAYLTTFTVASLLKEVQKVFPAQKELFIQSSDLSVRIATAEDFFILPFGSAGLLGVKNPAGQPYGLDPANPIEAAFVLDKDEVAVVKDYTNAYNVIIKSIAQSKNLALYDAFADFNDIADADGLTENGIKFTSDFISGNLFGLDGIHLTPRGYAHAANSLIKVINNKYREKIPLTDVSKFRGIKTLE